MKSTFIELLRKEESLLNLQSKLYSQTRNSTKAEIWNRIGRELQISDKKNLYNKNNKSILSI